MRQRKLIRSIDFKNGDMLEMQNYIHIKTELKWRSASSGFCHIQKFLSKAEKTEILNTKGRKTEFRACPRHILAEGYHAHMLVSCTGSSKKTLLFISIDAWSANLLKVSFPKVLRLFLRLRGKQIFIFEFRLSFLFDNLES